LNGINVTDRLSANADSATGMLLVTEDTSYTLEVTIQDTQGNPSTATSTFYVPPDPTSITPPIETEDAGFVSGTIFATGTCSEHLTDCRGLAGVSVTLTAIDAAALQQMRLQRTLRISTKPSDQERAEPLLSAAEVSTFATALDGTVVTGPDGFFAFPVPATGVYWLRAEKDGYTYAQRQLEVVMGRSVATNALYLTPIDSTVTECGSAGCSHTNSDGSIQIKIPAGAIGDGETVAVTATNFKHVEYLPSGELPEDTWETYAFNLGGDSDFAFQPGQTATVRLRNDKGFTPGTQIPLGYWNQSTQAWEHAGTGVVDSTGEWLEMTVTHFSNYDCNDPVSPLEGVGPNIEPLTDDPESTCQAGEGGCFVSIQDGTFEETIDMPPVQVLGQEIAPSLIYNSSTVVVNAVIDTKLSLNVGAGVEVGDHIGFELFVQGQKSQPYTFEGNLVTGEVGRYRYLWDGKDGQGNLLGPGVYDYEVKFPLPYRAQYCYALNGIFGAPPDCVNGATGVFVDATEDLWTRGTVELNPQVNSPYGAGWMLLGQQHLYENEAGQILITDGQRNDEFYFSGKDQLLQERLHLARSVSLVQASGISANPVIRIDGEFSTSAAPLPEVIVSGTESPNSTEQTSVPADPPWKDIAPFPVSIMDNTAAALDGRIYSVGGYDGTRRLKSGYVYDPQNNNWSAIADMNTVRTKPSAAFINGQLYVAGGANAGYTNKTMEVYDPPSNSWRFVASMPEGRSVAPGVVVNGQFYVIGGCADNCKPSPKAFRYDPITDTWSEIAPYPLPIAWHACGAIAGQIYCAGGTTRTKDQGSDVTTVHTYVYNPSLNRWTRLADMRQDQWGASFTAADGKLYISAGVTNGTRTTTNESFVYDPATDRWQRFESAHYALYRRASACGFYQFGGSPSGFRPQTSAEVYPGLVNCDTEPTIYSRTSTDFSTLNYDAATDSYTRRYPNGMEVHFHGDGRHNFTRDPDGRKTVYSYHADGKLASMGIVPPGGTAPQWVWEFVYSASGKLQRITNPAGQDTGFTVDPSGNLTQVSYPDTTTHRFAYDNRHLLTAHTNPNQQTTTHRYDGYGRITELIEAERPVYDPETGEITSRPTVRRFTPSDTSYGFINDSAVGDPESPAAAVTTSSELVDRVTYERGGRSGIMSRWGTWLEMTDSISRTVRMERDGANNITRLAYPDSDCIEFTYDGLGNVTERLQMPSEQCALADTARNSALLQRWNYSYESRFNNIKTETDPLGFTTRYIYDYEEGVSEAGRLIRIEYPAITIDGGGQVTPTVRYSYNSLGLMETMTDEAGITTRYRYDAAGRLTQMIENEGGLNLTTTFQDFDAAGRPQTVIAPRNNISRYTYDSWGRLLTITDPLGVVTTYQYDGRGNVIRTTADDTADESSGRNLVTNYSYDVHDRLLSQQINADGMRWSDAYSYDGNGNLATHTDSESQTTTFIYDAANQLTGVEDPLNQTTGFTYTAKSELATITQANGKEIRFGYDAFGNLTALTPPDRPAHSFNYSLRQETTAYTPPDAGIGATKTGYTYDALGLLTGETRPDGRTIRYAYDSALRLIRLTQPRGDTTYSYNTATDQLTGIAAPEGVTLSYGYDNELLTSIAWSGPLNGAVNYGYDDRYRLTALAVNGVNTIAYAYDSSSFLTKAGDLAIERLPQSRALDGTSLNQVTDSYGYDGFGKLTRYQASAGGSIIYELRYSYDDLDRIATQTETIGDSSTAYAYSYDAVGRLIGVTANGATVTYTYDGNGNRLTGPGGAAGSYDAQDRMLSYGGASYTYTANGELLTKVENGQTTTYNYDVFSNLMAVTLPDGTQIEYLIDGMDRRIGRKVNGALEQGWLYHDQLNPVAELDGSGNVISRFVYATSDHVPDYMIKGGVTYRIISDHLGSVHLVVNAATGAIAQQMNYDEFGRVIQDTNPGFQPFAFAGGLYDRDTGLVRFGARDYDAAVGRWTTKDPIGFNEAETNLYAYTLNNPTNFTDPQGLFTHNQGANNLLRCYDLPQKDREQCERDAFEEIDKGVKATKIAAECAKAGCLTAVPTGFTTEDWLAYLVDFCVQTIFGEDMDQNPPSQKEKGQK
jgi:RHS repeat-associated protein